MIVQFTNRTGKTYYLRAGKTKTGKPRYFFSPHQNGKGEAVEHIPEGYEIYEHPANAQIFLRKKRPKIITDIEKHRIEKYVEQLKRSRRYRMDCKDDCITIYESDTDIGGLKDSWIDFLKHAPLCNGMTTEEAMSTLVRNSDKNYTAVMRFRLTDKKQRTFVAERFCFRGAIDDWIFLGGPDDLKKLAGRYIELLGTDEFFDSPFY